ncbi:MAG: hypothetical protein ACI4KF_09485 [Huintestinicola sp.]
MAKLSRKPKAVKGAVLIMVLTVLAVMLIMLAGAISIAANASKSALVKHSQTQSYYFAKSSVDMILDTLLTDNGNVEGSNGTSHDLSLGGKSQGLVLQEAMIGELDFSDPSNMTYDITKSLTPSYIHDNTGSMIPNPAVRNKNNLIEFEVTGDSLKSLGMDDDTAYAKVTMELIYCVYAGIDGSGNPADFEKKNSDSTAVKGKSTGKIQLDPEAADTDFIRGMNVKLTVEAYSGDTSGEQPTYVSVFIGPEYQVPDINGKGASSPGSVNNNANGSIFGGITTGGDYFWNNVGDIYDSVFINGELRVESQKNYYLGQSQSIVVNGKLTAANNQTFMGVDLEQVGDEDRDHPFIFVNGEVTGSGCTLIFGSKSQTYRNIDLICRSLTLTGQGVYVAGDTYIADKLDTSQQNNPISNGTVFDGDLYIADRTGASHIFFSNADTVKPNFNNAITNSGIDFSQLGLSGNGNLFNGLNNMRDASGLLTCLNRLCSGDIYFLFDMVNDDTNLSASDRPTKEGKFNWSPNWDPTTPGDYTIGCRDLGLIYYTIMLYQDFCMREPTAIYDTTYDQILAKLHPISSKEHVWLAPDDYTKASTPAHTLTNNVNNALTDPAEYSLGMYALNTYFSGWNQEGYYEPYIVEGMKYMIQVDDIISADYVFENVMDSITMTPDTWNFSYGIVDKPPLSYKIEVEDEPEFKINVTLPKGNASKRLDTSDSEVMAGYNPSEPDDVPSRYGMNRTIIKVTTLMNEFRDNILINNGKFVPENPNVGKNYFLRYVWEVPDGTTGHFKTEDAKFTIYDRTKNDLASEYWYDYLENIALDMAKLHNQHFADSSVKLNGEQYFNALFELFNGVKGIDNVNGKKGSVAGQPIDHYYSPGTPINDGTPGAEHKPWDKQVTDLNGNSRYLGLSGYDKITWDDNIKNIDFVSSVDRVMANVPGITFSKAGDLSSFGTGVTIYDSSQFREGNVTYIDPSATPVIYLQPGSYAGNLVKTGTGELTILMDGDYYLNKFYIMDEDFYTNVQQVSGSKDHTGYEQAGTKETGGYLANYHDVQYPNIKIYLGDKLSSAYVGGSARSTLINTQNGGVLEGYYYGPYASMNLQVGHSNSSNFRYHTSRTDSNLHKDYNISMDVVGSLFIGDLSVRNNLNIIYVEPDKTRGYEDGKAFIPWTVSSLGYGRG